VWLRLGTWLTTLRRADVDVSPADPSLIRVTLTDGQCFDTQRAFLMAGAQSKLIAAEALSRDPDRNASLAIPEFDETCAPHSFVRGARRTA
jgi:hypothetical protein